MRYDCEVTAEDGCTKTHTMQIRLQKLANPYLRGRPAGPHEKDEGGSSRWSKTIIIVMLDVNALTEIETNEGLYSVYRNNK